MNDNFYNTPKIMNQTDTGNRTKNVSMNEVTFFPYNIEIIATNLVVPWAIAISDHGKMYVTERSGSIRLINNGKLINEPVITFDSPFISRGEGGLLGIALNPDFSDNHYIYVMQSYLEGSQIFNRVLRLIENNNKVTIDKVLLNQIPGGQIHNGGRIKVGPDKKLYITTGDAGDANLAQDLSSYAGKILRMNLDGTVPEDNPFTNSLIYSYGHRNPQGLAWNSKNMLYASEHGSRAQDEINLILPGRNYGWPLVQGDANIDEIVSMRPIIHSGNETWAPSGISFVTVEPWITKLFVATLRGEKLLAITLDSSGTQVDNIEVWLSNQYGRLREVIESPDGNIYITTSNRDGRGVTRPGDDKILRLI